MKKKWLTVIGAVILATAITTVAFAPSPIKLVVNGQEIKPDVPPHLINGRTMVPIRWVAEALGADVQWDERSNAVVITKEMPGVSESDLPHVFRNISSKFEGIEVPVYLPTYLPYNGALGLSHFKTSKGGYSFKLVPKNGESHSMADEVVTMVASQQPFSPFPTEEQLFSGSPGETFKLSGIQVQSYNAGMGVRWSKGSWEFVAIGHGVQDGIRVAEEVIQCVSETTILYEAS